MNRSDVDLTDVGPDSPPPGQAPHAPSYTSEAATPPRARGVVVRRIAIAGLALVGVVVLYLVVSILQVVQAGREHDADPADAIVVLGAAQYDGRPSPQLASRLDHAVTLFEQGVAPVVVVTGGNQPGDRFTEAEASREYLVAAGIPADVILGEDEGRTTFESLDNVAVLLAGTGSDGRPDVVLVTDPYHAKRSELTAAEVGLDADAATTPTSVVGGWASVRRHLMEGAGVALGRLIGFDRLSELTD